MNKTEQTEQTPQALMTMHDAAELLSVSAMTVRRLISRGELRSHRVGRQVRIRRDDLQAYIRGAAAV